MMYEGCATRRTFQDKMLQNVFGDESAMDPIYMKRLRHQQARVKDVEIVRKSDFEDNSFVLNSPKLILNSPSRFKKRALHESNTRVKKSKDSERFIPRRSESNWQTKFTLDDSDEEDFENKNLERKAVNLSTLESGRVYSSLLKNELLDSSIGSMNESKIDDREMLFNFTPKRISKENSVSHSLSPIGASSQRLLSSPKFDSTKIPTVPFKILDAPNLIDDFYLNLLDWSPQNVLSVGLGNCVYLWSAFTNQITGVCELPEEGNSVASVQWNPSGTHLSVGTNKGTVLLYDATAGKVVASIPGHSGRVGTLAWNSGNVITSGGRDRKIIQRDLRMRTGPRCVRKLTAHVQEVCGLQWSSDGQHLASGGNDNKINIWNCHTNEPIFTFEDHTSAVKAISWSPHTHGLLATGGGSADRTIRFWNTLTGQSLHYVDTGSQVCNLAWSKHSSQLVSTHGFSQNQILLWNYPSMSQVVKLTGHSLRVLYLALSPDGETIVTGAGDETLRFWSLFSKTPPRQKSPSQVSLYTNIR